jgi:endonuclease/exonuclease/phosphatase family metal-dependent hydrolase
MRLPLICLVLAATAAPLPALADTTLRVMSFNIWGGGGNEGKGIDETVAVMKAAGADIIAVQETRLEGADCTADACPAQGPSVAPALAAALGYHLYEATAVNDALWANAILSRYPVGAATANGLGVPVDVGGVTVWVFNIHLDDAPYQPYQLLGIPYGDAPFIATGAEAADWAARTRGAGMALLSADMAAAGQAPVVVMGDFNEPSALDWTAAAVAAGQKPVAVDWPATRGLLDAGFVDAYRAVHPDPVAKPAFTWTPRYPENAADDHPDRIDMILARAPGLAVRDAWIVGEAGPRTDLAVDPWPSDHRAVMAEIVF